MTIEEMIAELQDTLVDIVGYDTWGNSEEGYWVNDQRKCREETEIDMPWFEYHFGTANALEVDDRADFGDDVYEIIETETGKPVGRIEVSVL